jgi:GH15 family glucan-1,4-alpha-glucosidase
MSTAGFSGGAQPSPYPPIADYALIGDGHSAALVSRSGSIDWCCMPRLDAGSSFGRLLDWERGGHCAVAPEQPDAVASHRYLDDTMVLETMFRASSGQARLLDCFTTHEGGARHPRNQLLRVVEGLRGAATFQVRIAARFDYGDVRPWVRSHHAGVWSAVGGNDALVIHTDMDLAVSALHDLVGTVTLRAGERARLSFTSVAPEQLEGGPPEAPSTHELDERLDTTIAWWREWATTVTIEGPDASAARRSALVLKALTNAPTGAIAAAATTSLPEVVGGTRNWDYRYAWIRDSQFTVRAMAELGCDREADGLRRFVERSAAGGASSLQIVYGLGGERRIPELELDLEGYGRSRPVRIGNSASEQRQLDVYGELLDLAWQWHQRGRSPDDDYWRFLLSLVDAAAEHWDEPDQSLWETRGEPRHFVHSKVMCWAALDRGIKLAQACMRKAPAERWADTRDTVRRSIERHGVDDGRGCFVRHYGTTDVDAALLLLPTVGFVAYDDPRMVATTDAVIADLDVDGLLARYRADDGVDGEEHPFVPCTFWLAECLARQGRVTEARAAYDRGVQTANDLALYGEEYDPTGGEILGNFPQALSHLSQIAAAVALRAGEGA